MILMNQARLHIERREFNKAENCFVQAKKPELAIKMYTDQGNFPEALRVSKKHAPHLVNEINSKYMTQAGTQNMSGDELFHSARLWEENRDWLKAIDTYLEIKREHFQDPSVLEEAWERAVHLALNYDKERCQDIVRIVGKRLREIGRFESAAAHYESIGLYEDAVQTYVQGEKFDRARDCVQQIRNQEVFKYK